MIKESCVRKILLKNHQSPGDIIMLTSAVRDLKAAQPTWAIGVDTVAMDIWDNNPHITKMSDNTDVEIIKVEYPLIHKSNEYPYHFIHAFRMFLEDHFQIKIPQGKFKGDIHLSDQECGWISQVEELGISDPYWIIMAGGKYDFTAKWWDPREYQKVVDHFKGKMLFVQCGEKNHFHPKLKGVVDLIGKTNIRQFIRLMYHSSGVVCPVTFAMHLATAVPMKPGSVFRANRPAVVLAGGREPAQWEAYPHHRFLSNNGFLPCCDNGGCWKSRCTKVGDRDEKDEKSLCLYPIKLSLEILLPQQTEKQNLYIPRCMEVIKARHVIEAIESYYPDGI